MASTISTPLADLLRAQIQSELTAHMNYMAISLYFERASLKRWAKLFHAQSMEEAGHAAKIMQFLIDVDVEFDLPSLPPCSTRFASAREAVESAAASEAKVTGEFRHMAKVALAEGDTTGFQFLQWFLEEQVEEESKMGDLLNLIDSGVNLFQAEVLLDGFEEEEA